MRQSCTQLQWVGASDGIRLFLLLLNSYLTEIITIFTIKSSNNFFFIAKNIGKSLLLTFVRTQTFNWIVRNLFNPLYILQILPHYISSFSYTAEKFSFLKWLLGLPTLKTNYNHYIELSLHNINALANDIIFSFFSDPVLE